MSTSDKFQEAPREPKAFIWELTGDIRSPIKGEWFVGYNNLPDMARFTFTVQKFPILRGRTVLLKEVAHLGDPCIYCGLAQEKFAPGPCRALCHSGVALEPENLESVDR